MKRMGLPNDQRKIIENCAAPPKFFGRTSLCVLSKYTRPDFQKVHG